MQLIVSSHTAPSKQIFLRIFLERKVPLIRSRRKLITAFLELGSSRPENFVTNARDWKWSNLQVACQAYRKEYDKMDSLTSKTEL